ncbi:hypothetical protein ERJ75_000687100 [Trypanosoma vivax]|nr:hypothetical protein ERJ75_000687100 [Trypanosoma vivax]
MVFERRGQRTVHTRRKLGETGHHRNIGPHRAQEWKEMKTGGSGADAARLAANWHIVKTICDTLIPVTKPQRTSSKKGRQGLGLVAGKLARAMEDFSKALHVDDTSTAVNVHALGKTSSGANGAARAPPEARPQRVRRLRHNTRQHAGPHKNTVVRETEAD